MSVFRVQIIPSSSANILLEVNGIFTYPPDSKSCHLLNIHLTLALYYVFYTQDHISPSRKLAVQRRKLRFREKKKVCAAIKDGSQIHAPQKPVLSIVGYLASASLCGQKELL